MKTLVCFDFDGTLTKKDTLFDIILFALGPLNALKVFLSFLPYFLLYKAGFMKNDEAKGKLFIRVFGGMPYGEFDKLCTSYSLHRVPLVVKAATLSCLQSHLELGHECLIVSASVKEWIEPWARRNGFSAVLSTKAAVKDNALTGSFENANCHGPEKVRRIETYLSERGLDRADCLLVAYGDSNGDDAMLAWADQGYRVKGQLVVPWGKCRRLHD